MPGAQKNVNMGTANPESLHLIANSQDSPTDGQWRNPGTPEAPLVTADQITKATITGNAAQTMRDNMIKG